MRYREVKQFIRSLMADPDFKPRQSDYIESKILDCSTVLLLKKNSTVVPPSHGFTFRSFSNPWSRILHGKCWSFKLHIILSGVMESPAFQLRPAWSVNHQLVQLIHTVATTCLLVT